jgi:hypothetical protein
MHLRFTLSKTILVLGWSFNPSPVFWLTFGIEVNGYKTYVLNRQETPRRIQKAHSLVAQSYG